MIESKLKANNCNRGQLFRSCWVSSAPIWSENFYEYWFLAALMHLESKTLRRISNFSDVNEFFYLGISGSGGREYSHLWAV